MATRYIGNLVFVVEDDEIRYHSSISFKWQQIVAGAVFAVFSLTVGVWIFRTQPFVGLLDGPFPWSTLAVTFCWLLGAAMLLAVVFFAKRCETTYVFRRQGGQFLLGNVPLYDFGTYLKFSVQSVPGSETPFFIVVANDDAKFYRFSLLLFAHDFEAKEVSQLLQEFFNPT